MLKFVRVISGADPHFDAHLAAIQSIFLKAFPFHPTYADKIAAYAGGS